VVIHRGVPFFLLFLFRSTYPHLLLHSLLYYMKSGDVGVVPKPHRRFTSTYLNFRWPHVAIWPAPVFLVHPEG
jgi:hypothetical protein